jgi:hypothetical protein
VVKQPLRAVRPSLDSTVKNLRSEEKKVHPSSKKPTRKSRQDKQIAPKPKSAKSRLCYTCKDASGAGFAANPLGKPAPRHHVARAANLRIWRGVCGSARATRRCREPAADVRFLRQQRNSVSSSNWPPNLKTMHRNSRGASRDVVAVLIHSRRNRFQMLCAPSLMHLTN